MFYSTFISKYVRRYLISNYKWKKKHFFAVDLHPPRRVLHSITCAKPAGAWSIIIVVIVRRRRSTNTNTYERAVTAADRWWWLLLAVGRWRLDGVGAVATTRTTSAPLRYGTLFTSSSCLPPAAVRGPPVFLSLVIVDRGCPRRPSAAGTVWLRPLKSAAENLANYVRAVWMALRVQIKIYNFEADFLKQFLIVECTF